MWSLTFSPTLTPHFPYSINLSIARPCLDRFSRQCTAHLPPEVEAVHLSATESHRLLLPFPPPLRRLPLVITAGLSPSLLLLRFLLSTTDLVTVSGPDHRLLTSLDPWGRHHHRHCRWFLFLPPMSLSLKTLLDLEIVSQSQSGSGLSGKCEMEFGSGWLHTIMFWLIYDLSRLTFFPLNIGLV